MSAETEKLFQRFLRELRPLFKENGFRSSSQNFILESAECWVIVNFQKSRWAGPDETTFYVNVGASSKRWLGFEGKPPEKMPPYYACDWQWRIEYFSPNKNIQQWTLRDEDSLHNTLSYLRGVFREFVLSAAKTMTTEADLLRHTGGFEYPQLKTRTVILAATHQVSALREAVNTLIEKFGSGGVSDGVRQHLSRLHSLYPEVMRSVDAG